MTAMSNRLVGLLLLALTTILLPTTTMAQKKTIYDFTVQDLNHQPVSMAEYKGKVLLIVNTATRCGFTPQYEGLEALQKKFEARGFETLGFPCNQFAHQTPENEAEIAQFCSLKYNVTFRQFAKVEVNGKNAIPLFVWLKEQKGGFLSSAIKWNFTKFLVDRNGNVIKRYGPTVKPESIEEDIIKLL